MPIRREIDHEGRIVRSICEGEMTAEDIQIDQRTFWTQDWLREFGEIFDMREADFSALVDYRSRYAAVATSDEQVKDVPVAMLHSDRHPSQRKVADQYVRARQVLDDVERCREFDDAEEAEAWLRAQL